MNEVMIGQKVADLLIEWMECACKMKIFSGSMSTCVKSQVFKYIHKYGALTAIYIIR